MSLHLIPLEIIIEIAKYNTYTADSYREGARWYLVHPCFTQDGAFNLIAWCRWTQLDRFTNRPRFRLQAAISGNVGPFLKASSIWKGIGMSNTFPVGGLTCNEPDITPPDVNIRDFGKQCAHDMEVFSVTAHRGTYNRNIAISSPLSLFKTRADEEVYLAYLRKHPYLLAGGRFGLRFLDVLCILCREDGPYPLRDGVLSPAFDILDLYLTHLGAPHRYLISSYLHPNTWPFLTGTMASHPAVLQRLWEYEQKTLNDSPKEFSDFVVVQLVHNCAERMFETYRAASDHALTPGSPFCRTLSWFCSTEGLRKAGLGCFMGRIIREKRLNAFTHLLTNHPALTEADINILTKLSKQRGLPEMSILLKTQNPVVAAETIIWRCSFWNWIDL